MALGSFPPPGIVLSSSGGSIPVSNAMLNSGDAWCAEIQNQNQYLQVDFGKERIVSGIAIQGDPKSDRWVKTFQLEYGNRTSSLKTYPLKGLAKVRISLLSSLFLFCMSKHSLSLVNLKKFMVNECVCN